MMSIPETVNTGSDSHESSDDSQPVSAGHGNSLTVRFAVNLPFQCMHPAISAVRGGPKIGKPILYALTLPNINGFSKFFHCQNQNKICNNTITKVPTTPQVCRYTTL